MIHLLLNKMGAEFVSLSLFGSENDEDFAGLIILITTVLIPLKFSFPGLVAYFRNKIYRHVINNLPLIIKEISITTKIYLVRVFYSVVVFFFVYLK